MALEYGYIQKVRMTGSCFACWYLSQYKGWLTVCVPHSSADGQLAGMATFWLAPSCRSNLTQSRFPDPAASGLCLRYSPGHSHPHLVELSDNTTFGLMSVRRYCVLTPFNPQRWNPMAVSCCPFGYMSKQKHQNVGTPDLVHVYWPST